MTLVLYSPCPPTLGLCDSKRCWAWGVHGAPCRFLCNNCEQSVILCVVRGTQVIMFAGSCRGRVYLSVCDCVFRTVHMCACMRLEGLCVGLWDWLLGGSQRQCLCGSVCVTVCPHAPLCPCA